MTPPQEGPQAQQGGDGANMSRHYHWPGMTIMSLYQGDLCQDS